MKKIAAVLLVTLTTGLVFHAHATDVALSAGGDIAAAITETGGSGTITLAAGTYTLAGEITVPSGVTITGTGSGDDGSIITSSSSTTRYMTISGGTVENVKILGRKLNIRPNQGMGVYITAGTLKNSRVTGFTADDYFQYGAVKVEGDNALVENCEIDSNTVSYGQDHDIYAGGVYLVKGTVSNCRIHDNVAHSGAGVMMTGGKLTGCAIYANQLTHIVKGSDKSGAGVWASGGTITSCVIAQNSPTVYAGVGGLHLEGKNVTVKDSVVRNNIAYNSTDVGFPDFDYTDATVSNNVSGCAFPVDFGSNCDTSPKFFTADWKVCPFTADKVEAFVGEAITFTDKNGASWTVSEASAGTYDVTRIVDGTGWTAKDAVRFAAKTTAVTTADELVAAVNGAVDGETITIAAGTYEMPGAIILTRGVTLEGAGIDQTILTLKKNVKDRNLMIAHPDVLVRKLTAKGGCVDLYARANTGFEYDIYGTSVWVGHRGGKFEQCRVTGGKAGSHYHKGILAVSGVEGHINRCIVDNNYNCSDKSSGNGWGPIYVKNGLVENCLVTNNYAFTAGGAYVKSGILRNCTFYKNGTLKKGAVYAEGGTIQNCVSMGSYVDKDTSTGSPEWGGTVACFDTCAFVGDITAPNDSCMIVADPFVDAASGDLHLKTGSAGLQDKGKDFEGIEDDLDLDGEARLSGKTVDIGAYELDASQFTCSFTCDKTEGFKGETYTFTSELGNPPAGATFTYAWTFDNGQGTVVASEEQNPALQLDIGTWNVSLTVTASTGKTATTALLAVTKVAVRDLYATAGGTGAFPYDDESKGCSDIVTLLALAIDGSTIHFGVGEFPVTSEIIINSAITFSGAGMHETVIKLTKSGTRVFTLNNPNAVIEKLTITGGSLNVRSDQGDGYGISVKIAANGGTLRECRVTKSESFNHFQYGHISVLGDAGHVDRCLIDGNDNMWQASSGNGYGTIYVKAGLVENCMITNNYSFTGGGAYVAGGTVRNCTFYKNDALVCGGVYATGGSVVNCVLAGDTSLASKDTLTGRPEWGSTGSCFANCAFTGIDAANLPSDTSFVASKTFVDEEAGNFTPDVGAGGLRDAGVTYEGAEAAVDYLSNPRLSGSAIDIGAIEADATAFACSADASPTACFVGTSVHFVSSITNAPAGVTFGYNWTITDRFGKVIERHEANPVLELPVGYYTVELTIYDLEKPTSQASVTPLVDYVHVALRDSYATAGNPNPVYPYDTAEKGTTNILELIDEAIAGTTIHIGEGVFTNNGEMVVEKGVTIAGEGMDKSLIRQGAKGKRVMTINHPDAVCEKVALTGGSLSAVWQQEDHFGVGVWIAPQGGTLRDCRVFGNVADGHYQHGGGVYVSEGLVDRCVIEENTNSWREVDSYGGGVAAEKGIVQNCLIRNNTATKGGGAWISKTAVMRNCTLVGNHAVVSLVYSTVGGLGGGLVFSRDGGTIENCILWDNTSVYVDPAGGGSELTFNTGAYDVGYNYTFRSTAVPTSVTSTLGGLVKIADPIFRNAEAGNYRLRTASPCRNAGTNGAWASAAKDLDGQPRLHGKAIDLGCYELQHGYGTTLIVR